MPSLRFLLVAALLAPLVVPSTADACVGGDMYCSKQLAGDPCVTPYGYGRCVQTGCAEAPARICNIENSVCGNAFLMNPCIEKESGDTCSLGIPDADGGTPAGTCKPFTCTDGGTALGCYVPMEPDPSAPGRSPADGGPSGSGTSSSNDGASSTSAGDGAGGCATSPRGGGSSSSFIVALAALGALGRKRRSSAATG